MFSIATMSHKALCVARCDTAEETDIASYFILVTNTGRHTRNKISTSAEAWTDKNVRRDKTAGQGGGMPRQRWRRWEAGGWTRS